MKKIENYRKEIDKLIEKHDFDLSNEEVVKRSLEAEKAMNDTLKNPKKDK